MKWLTQEWSRPASRSFTRAEPDVGHRRNSRQCLQGWRLAPESGTRTLGASLPLLAAAGRVKLPGVAAFGATTGCGATTSPLPPSVANFGRSLLIYQRLSHDMAQRKSVHQRGRFCDAQ